MAIILNVDQDGPVTKRRETYWLALGRFLHRFARIEHQIIYLLRLECGLDDKTANAVFSGVRVKTALEHIGRVRAAKGLPASHYFDRASRQLGLILSARDLVIHHGVEVQNDAFIASNERRMPAGRGRREAVPPEALDAMRADLETISECIYALQCEANGQDYHQADHRCDPLGPWQYKPTQPAQKQGKSPRIARKRKRPPQSSEA